ncbi:MAG: hypothetical protein JG774_1876 [Desulfomicrobiaceae bacterium]|nr:hypothetical protein [Desulfomicrobiaceae bacterium]
MLVKGGVLDGCSLDAHHGGGEVLGPSKRLCKGPMVEVSVEEDGGKGVACAHGIDHRDVGAGLDAEFFPCGGQG